MTRTFHPLRAFLSRFALLRGTKTWSTLPGLKRHLTLDCAITLGQDADITFRCHRSPQYILIALLCVAGYSAPRGRLSFLDAPIKSMSDIAWYDANHDGRRDFGLRRSPDGRDNTLLYDNDEDGRTDRVFRQSDYPPSYKTPRDAPPSNERKADFATCRSTQMCWDIMPLCQDLQARGMMDAEGYADEAAWFEHTLDHPWPDALRRVWNALHGKVVNPANVLLFIRDGHCAGLKSYEKFIKMASTHGGLNQANSATFAMTMTGRLTRPLPHEQLMHMLAPDSPGVLRREDK